MSNDPLREYAEHLACIFIQYGAGNHRVPDEAWTDEVIIGYPLGETGVAIAFFRQKGKTVRTVELRISAVPEAQQADWRRAALEPDLEDRDL